MKVYALGIVSYDIRAAIPSEVYSTLDLAQASRDIESWERDGAWWFGVDSRGTDWAIAEREVIEP